MDLSVLTVTWNSAKYIAEQIESVRKGTKKFKVEQLVADNGSKDDTVEIIKAKHPEIQLIDFKKNTGFGFANNRLAEKAGGKYFLLLNPDLEVLEDGVQKIYQFAEEHTDAGVVGGLLLEENGSVKTNALPRNFPTVFDQFVILFKLHHLFPQLLNDYLALNRDITKPSIVDSVQGSFLLVRRDLYLKMTRLFDERYFIWFEDVDLCRETIKNGYKVWFVPVPVAKDFGGRSFAKRNFLWKQYNFSKSMFQYFRKWGISKSTL